MRVVTNESYDPSVANLRFEEVLVDRLRFHDKAWGYRSRPPVRNCALGRGDEVGGDDGVVSDSAFR
jgi:hypothetical protein